MRHSNQLQARRAQQEKARVAYEKERAGRAKKKILTQRERLTVLKDLRARIEDISSGAGQFSSRQVDAKERFVRKRIGAVAPAMSKHTVRQLEEKLNRALIKANKSARRTIG